MTSTIGSILGVPVIESRYLPPGVSLLLAHNRAVTADPQALRNRIELRNWLADRVAEIERKWFG
jgi:hypothetical protein